MKWLELQGASVEGMNMLKWIKLNVGVDVCDTHILLIT